MYIVRICACKGRMYCKIAMWKEKILFLVINQWELVSCNWKLQPSVANDGRSLCVKRA